MKNPHIIIEGLDGAGKGLTCDTVEKTLVEMGITTHRTREPGGTPLAEAIRGIFKSVWENEIVSPKTDIMMLYSAREQLYTNMIMPILAEGDTAIIQDRSWMTGFAYQLRGLGILTDEKFWTVHNFVMNDKPTPDLVILLDIPPEIGFERILKARGDNSADRMEIYDMEFYQKARQGYLELLSDNLVPNMVKVDANRPIEEVQRDIAELVKQTVAR